MSSSFLKVLIGWRVNQPSLLVRDFGSRNIALYMFVHGTRKYQHMSVSHKINLAQRFCTNHPFCSLTHYGVSTLHSCDDPSQIPLDNIQSCKIYSFASHSTSRIIYFTLWALHKTEHLVWLFILQSSKIRIK